MRNDAARYPWRIERIAVGRRLGPYEIVARIGAGGMGEVWRANDTRLGRAVAVKILPPELAQNAQLKIRFEREARAISQLSHPNICTLHDVGEDNGTSFLVMELLEGETLAERIARGPLPLHEVLRFGVQIAVALDRAHRQHVVHRDLKPGNVMLTRGGAKLLDFGLAKTITGAAAAEPIVASALTQKLDERQPLTAEGTIVGTFQYMAPEQLEGADADGRTDIFALGAVLYEMTTGQRAFQGKTRTSLIAAIVRGEPQPLAQLQPLTPPALEHVIARCLAKDPEERWQSAADVAAELEWISHTGSQAGVAAPVIERRKRRERTWIAIAGALAIAAIVLAVLLARRKTPEALSIHANLVAPPSTSFVLTRGHGGSLTVSPDGKWVTFAAEGGEDDQPALWIRPIDSHDARKLITEPFVCPFWSPDSRSIAYIAEGKLKRVDVAGGPPTIICDAQDGRGGTWSVDGTIVFAPHWRGPLHRVSASGGTSQPITKLDEKSGETTHRFPSFLPDGKHFLYLGGTHLAAPNSERNAIYLTSLDAPNERRLLLRARSNAIYTNGQMLFVRENYLLAQPLDPETLKLGGEAKRVADAVEYEAGYFTAAFAAGGDGTLVYAPKLAPIDEPLVWHDRSGKSLGTAALVPGPWHYRLTPDGHSIVVVYGDPSDVWLYDLARGSRRRVTHDPLNDFLPIWSADATRVAYASDRSLFVHLYMRRVDGTGDEELLLQTQQMKSPSDWSRDGRYLFFEAASDVNSTKYDLWLLDMTDRKPRRLTNTEFDEYGARISPDGHWLTYSSDESGRRETYVTSFPALGERQQVSTNGSTGDGIWTRDGREIVYLSADRKVMAVGVTPSGSALQVSAPQELFTVPRRAVMDVTKDGEKFLVYEPVASADTPLTLITNWH